MKLKADKKLRNQWFAPSAMAHPAKGHLGLWWELFERYTHPGQWVLDPMAGIGSSMIGAMMGRNVICNEMESHFIAPMKASWTKMRQQAMLGCELGQVLIIQGDARCLPLGRADVVVTSPPYEGSIQGEPGIDFTKIDGGKRDMTKEPGYATRVASHSGYTRPVDVVVTSPPYEGSIADIRTGDDRAAQLQRNIDLNTTGRETQRIMRKGMNPHSSLSAVQSYTRPAAVITSPPYEDSIHRGGVDTFDASKSPDWHPGPNSQAHMGNGYRATEPNIGNLRGNAYWEAMRLVYAECHRVLAPGGVMVLVVKGYTRDGQYVDLPQQTVDECEKLGFKLGERWDRELWGLSFWRILQGTTKQTRQVALQIGLTEESTTEIIETKRVNNGKVDERLRFEPVLVLKKD